MPAYVLKNNFTSGELSPLLHRRSDIQQHKNGLATCLNAIVDPRGGASRRFGTKYVVAAKYSTKIAVLRKFEFSATQNYLLEIGEYYIRFIYDHAQIVAEYENWVTATAYAPGDLRIESDVYYRCVVAHTSGTFATDLAAGYWVGTVETDTAYEIATPYTEDELRELRFEQSNDVLYIFHASHHPAKLTRYAHATWTLTDVVFEGGPFLDDNETATTLTPSAVTGNGITVTATAAIFTSGYIGTLWKLSNGKMISTETGAFTAAEQETDYVISGVGTVEIEIAGTWVGAVAIYRCFNLGPNTEYEAEWWYTYKVFTENTLIHIENSEDGVGFKAVCQSFTSGTINVRISTLDPSAPGQGTFRITAVAENALSCTANVIDDIRSTDATTIWAKPAFSGSSGYPRVGKIFDGRLILACTDGEPTGVWGSSVLDYYDMKAGTNDDEAFKFFFDAKGGINVAKWMESWKQLTISTLGGEIRLEAVSGTITPSKPPNKHQDSNFGSADIQGFVAFKSILFIDRSGRVLREYKYNLDMDAFDSQALSLLSEHILNNGGGVVDMAYQQRQDSIVWCALEDGTLGALTYVPDQNVIGWHRHALGGSSR